MAAQADNQATALAGSNPAPSTITLNQEVFMGYMKHDAIVVTSWNMDHLGAAHEEAVKIGLSVSDLTKAVINGYKSFLIAPDGSKEGWDDSEIGKDMRKQWIDYMDSSNNYSEWIHVQFAGDQISDNEIKNFNGK